MEISVDKYEHLDDPKPMLPMRRKVVRVYPE